MTIYDYTFIVLFVLLMYALIKIWLYSNALVNENYKLREELDIKIVTIMSLKKEKQRLEEIIRKYTKLAIMESQIK